MLKRLVLNAMSAGIILAVGACVACSPGASPDQIRQKTAESTATLKQDTKAVAQGIKEGLTSKKSVDLNKSSREELSSLPGITDKDADRIIAERPYASAHQLVSRHVVSETEYAQIQDRVVVSR
jgi:DNA uptake protein ComE-like DNA-binding protein